MKKLILNADLNFSTKTLFQILILSSTILFQTASYAKGVETRTKESSASYLNLQENIDLKIEQDFLIIKAHVVFASTQHSLSFSLDKKFNMTSSSIALTQKDNQNISVYSAQSDVDQLDVEYRIGLKDVKYDSTKGLQLYDVFWTPHFENSLITGHITSALPEGWIGISSNDVESTNQEDLIFVAGPYKVKQISAQINNQTVLLQFYSQSMDDKTIQDYLDLSTQYLNRYSQSIGQYPYSKFSIVENTLEPTGLGFPSFTLIGTDVLNLPFIRYTSLPHEILHNWWGNSVYVDYMSGNWCEGLTTFMADQDMAVHKDGGIEYRWSSLRAYSSFTKTHAPYALRDFHGKAEATDNVIGYNRSMMVFSMLKLLLGDQNFGLALQDFFSNHKFQVANWKDLETSFQKFSQKDLHIFFQEQLESAATPVLSVTNLQSVLDNNQHQYVTTFDLNVGSNTSSGFHLPVRMQINDSTSNSKESSPILLTGKTHITFVSDFKPTQLLIDPRFETFRDLPDEENPVSLNELFGTVRPTLLVVPQNATPTETQLADSLMLTLKNDFGLNVSIIKENDPMVLPGYGNVWVIGTHNSAVELFKSRQKYPFDYSLLQDKAFVITARAQTPPTFVKQNWAWIDAGAMSASSLVNRIIHYGKFSTLIFGSQNVDKQVWPILESPLRPKL